MTPRTDIQIGCDNLARERNYWLDNTKAMLILLVVLGHAADYYTDVSDDMKVFFFFVYLFHMPLFIFLSGLFSKSIINGKRLKLEKIVSYLILFVSLNILIFSIRRFVMGQDNSFSLFSVDGVPWYMFAMAAWLALTYLLKDIKPQVLIVLSVLLALYVGYDHRVGDFLVASRIIVFYPMFLLGYYLPVEKVMKLKQYKVLVPVAAFVLVSIFLAVYFRIDDFYQLRPFLSGRNSYETAGQETLGGLIRFVWYGATIVISMSILMLMPMKKFSWSVIGMRTLPIYFLHRPLIYLFHHFGLDQMFEDVLGGLWVEAYMFFFLFVGIALAWQPLEWPFKKVMGLRLDRIYHRSETIRSPQSKAI